MKNKSKVIITACVILFGIPLFCMSAIWLMDKGLNGVFKRWLYNQIWSSLKQNLIYIFIVLVTVFALCTVFSAYFYARHKRKKDIRFLSGAINSIMKSDDLVLPQQYYEIETQITKIKAISQRQQQLMETEMQRKNDLITYLAHDLKTPLASVIGYLSLLDEAQDMPAEQKTKYTGIALQKAYRLEDLINEFFEIIRFNLQTIVLNKSKINLIVMLQQMADEFYPMLAPQGKQVAVHVPDDLIVIGDADKLARVFNNILKNAIAYSYDNSVIDINADRQDERVVLTFTNHGDPIPPHKLETIFEKFYRLDSSRATNTGGAGLGLAIAKEIVTAHGGTIAAESGGEQTLFTVTLPYHS